LKKPNREKNRSVRFRFYKHKTEKTEPNPNWKKNQKNRAKLKKPSQNQEKSSQTSQNRAKPKKTKPNQFEPIFVLKNITETDRFEPVSVPFFLNFNLVTSF